MALEMKYFVLKPRGNNVHAAASRKAMRAYASHIEKEDPELGKDLRAWAYSEGTKAIEDESNKIRDKY